MQRPTKAEVQAAVGKTVPDVIGPGLAVLFVGINPGLYSAAVGHHFARPGNRFWPALHQAGFTPRLLGPRRTASCPAWGLGITNLVCRTTTAASELSAEELRQGRLALEEKVARYGPRGWRSSASAPTPRRSAGGSRRWGCRRSTIGQSRVWVLPNTSGLNAHYTPARFAEVFRELRLTACGD